MNHYYLSLSKWTIMKLVVWAFSGVVGIRIIDLRYSS